MIIALSVSNSTHVFAAIREPRFSTKTTVVSVMPHIVEGITPNQLRFKLVDFQNAEWSAQQVTFRVVQM